MYEQTFAITSTVPTKTGYDFAGWNDGTSTYASGASYTMPNSNVTLTAQWTSRTDISLTLSADYTGKPGNHGAITAGSQTSVTATYNSAMPAISGSGKLPTRLGYDFAGYYGGKAGTGTKYYNANGTSAHVCDITSGTLYAHWTPKTIHITLNPNATVEQGLTNAGTTEFYFKYDTKAYFTNSACTSSITTLSAPTRTGYTWNSYKYQWTADQVQFDGSTGLNQLENYSLFGSGDLYYDFYFDATLTAYWDANTYTVSYAGMDGASYGTNHPTSGTYGTYVTINNPNKNIYLSIFRKGPESNSIDFNSFNYNNNKYCSNTYRNPSKDKDKEEDNKDLFKKIMSFKMNKNKMKYKNEEKMAKSNKGNEKKNINMNLNLPMTIKVNTSNFLSKIKSKNKNNNNNMNIYEKKLKK